jgi:hypothetical protein
VRLPGKPRREATLMCCETGGAYGLLCGFTLEGLEEPEEEAVVYFTLTDADG